jgi:prevent-host-death family protein
MQTVPASLARQKLGELVNRVYRRQARIIVEKSGIPVAALVSLADLERCIRLSPEPDTGPSEVMMMSSQEKASTQPVSREELAQRQVLVARVLANAEKRVIAPLTTAGLVHQVREEEQEAYERRSR